VALKELLYEKCARKTLMKLTPAVNFINIICAFFVRTLFRQLFLGICNQKKSCQNDVRMKKRAKNVDEIDPQRAWFFKVDKS